MHGIKDNETLGIRLGNFPNATKYKRTYGCGLSRRGKLGSQLIRILKVDTGQSEYSEKYIQLKNVQDWCKTMKIFPDGQANSLKLYREGKRNKMSLA